MCPNLLHSSGFVRFGSATHSSEHDFSGRCSDFVGFLSINVLVNSSDVTRGSWVHHLALLVLFYSITNFLKSLFSFVVRSFTSWVPLQVLDVSFGCFTDMNDFASPGAVFSSFVLTNLYFSLSFYIRFHSFIIYRVYKFSYLGANAGLAENADILLLIHTYSSNCCWLLYYLTVGCGVC